MVILQEQKDLIRLYEEKIFKNYKNAKRYSSNRFDYLDHISKQEEHDKVRELWFNKKTKKIVGMRNNRYGIMQMPLTDKFIYRLRWDKRHSHFLYFMSYEGLEATYKSKLGIYWRQYTYPYLSINNKGYTIFKGKVERRPNYLSLKNWQHLYNMLPYINDRDGFTGKGSITKSLMYYHIPKRWVLDLDKIQHYPISNKDARKCDTIKEAVSTMVGYNISNRLIDKVGASGAMMMGVLLPENQISLASQTLYEHDGVKKNFKAMQMLSGMIGMRLQKRGLDSLTIYDYVKMSFKTGQKINLNIGRTSLLRDHNNLSNQFQIGKIGKVKTVKKYMDVFSYYNGDIELINDADRLVAEGKNMGHCVASYGNSINRGTSSIWHTEYDGSPYTIEVGLNGSLYANQIKGRFNANPPQELVEKINFALMQYAKDIDVPCKPKHLINQEEDFFF
jgi:hypothetical protein